MIVTIHSLMKIQKYRTTRNNVKLLENVSQLKKTYSIHAAARKLNLQYSHLHRLLKCRQEHGRALSQTAKENVIKSYSCNKMSMQLPFKKYAKFYYLRTSLAVAYDSYAREQMNLHDDDQSVHESSQMGNGVGETEGVSDGTLGEPIKNRDDNKSVDEMAETGNSIREKESDVRKEVMSGGASGEQIPNLHDDDQSVHETSQMGNCVGETEG